MIYKTDKEKVFSELKSPRQKMEIKAGDWTITLDENGAPFEVLHPTYAKGEIMAVNPESNCKPQIYELDGELVLDGMSGMDPIEFGTGIDGIFCKSNDGNLIGVKNNEWGVNFLLLLEDKFWCIMEFDDYVPSFQSMETTVSEEKKAKLKRMFHRIEQLLGPIKTIEQSEAEDEERFERFRENNYQVDDEDDEDEKPEEKTYSQLKEENGWSDCENSEEDEDEDEDEEEEE